MIIGYSCKFSRRSKRLKLKTKTFSASRTKATSSKLSDYHDLQILELDQEIHTIPTLVNGVTRITTMKPNPDNGCASIEEIKHHIDNLRTLIRNQNE